MLALGAWLAAFPPPARAATSANAAAGAPEESLPIPPIPPENPPDDVAAPVPNVDIYAPKAPTQDGVIVRPSLNARAPTLPGGDPVPGTVYRSDQEQKRQFIPNPGIQLVLPLEK
jgi:hypothetical protein